MEFYEINKIWFELSSEIKGLTNIKGAQHCIPRHIYTYDMNNCVLSTQCYTTLKYLPTPIRKSSNLDFLFTIVSFI